jgi:hypothetical protein
MSKQKHVRKPVPMPLMLRIVRWVFPKLERISPRIALVLFDQIFFSPFRYKTPKRELPAERSARQFEVTFQNKRVQCYEWGDASQPYVLVVHGWAGRATQFRKFIPVFNRAGYRLIGFDGPAHGKSDGRRTSIAEFEEAMKAIVREKGNPEAIIAHSFGGGASLFAIVNGLRVDKLITIATPTIADLIIQAYLKAIGGSWAMGLAFKKLIEQRHGKPFEQFTAMELIKRVPAGFQLMMINDEEDRDVELIHSIELKKIYPDARMMITKGLGHNRILKDEGVISACLAFVKEKDHPGV